MISKEIEELIIKFLTNSISDQDMEKLNNWILLEDNEDLFKEYVALNYALNHNATYGEKDKMKNILLKRIQKDKKFGFFKKVKPYYKYAAIFIIILSIGYFMRNELFVPSRKLIIPEEVITLQLGNGDTEILQDQGTSQILNEEGFIIGNHFGNKLVYIERDQPNKILNYNTINVPYGKKYEIKLADGTNIKLNAGSTLRFPTSFNSNENRRVFLNGEAYFSVKHDAGRPFIVEAGDTDIQVLGTEFNVSNYPEDKFITTVLIDGSVGINDHLKPFSPANTTILAPGEKGVWNKQTNEIRVSNADIAMHTDWINGKIIFRHLQFKDIIKKLERHYNVTIQNNNKELNDQTFTASFDIETIQEVFQAFNKNFKIDYEIEGNKIIIN